MKNTTRNTFLRSLPAGFICKGLLGIVIAVASVFSTDIPAQESKATKLSSEKNAVSKKAIVSKILAETPRDRSFTRESSLATITPVITKAITVQPNPKAVPQSSIRDIERSTASKINSALQKRSFLKWNELPLQEAANEIAKANDIVIVLDRQAIEDAGYDTAIRISADAQGRTLFATLNSAFRDYDFTFVIIDESMLITTQEAIAASPERYLTTEVYSVTDIESKPEEIVAILENHIDPQSWLNTNAGPGTVTTLQNGKSEVLVVTQTFLNHLKIEELLDGIRSASTK